MTGFVVHPIVTPENATDRIMATDTLRQLEKKLDMLIELCDQLQAENNSLRDKESALLKERSKLLEKNETARTRVEAMITRLKSLDTEGRI